MHLYVLDLADKVGPAEPVWTDLRSPCPVWNRDGTKLFVTSIEPGKEFDPIDRTKPQPLVSWTFDPATKEKKPLGLPAGHAVADLSPNASTFLTTVLTDWDTLDVTTYLVPADTMKPRALREKSFKGMRFSPDGTRVLGTRVIRKDGEPQVQKLVVVTIADGSETEVKLPKEVVGVTNACWSPDGKRVAFEWNEEVLPPPNVPVPAGPNKFYASRVTVADADGSNAKTIVKREFGSSITGVDWR
jgi:hypothetical protein